MANSARPFCTGFRSRRVVAGSVVGLSLSLALALAGCGGSSSTGGTGNTSGSTFATVAVTCPSASDQASWKLVSAGKLTIASDTTYAPAEFEDPNKAGTYVGYDMDLAREFARRLCITADIKPAQFTAIETDLTAAPLGQQRYDMSLSSFTIKPERQAREDMIPYFTAGESILVKTGNPANIKAIQDMCGKTIGVQNGTVEKDELDDANGKGNGDSGQSPVCKDKPILEVSLDSQQDVVAQVLNGRADASYQDQPVTDYFTSLNKGKLESGGITVQPSPQGIVMRKDNKPLEDAIKKALDDMRKDGTYLHILKTWGVEKLAYPPLS